MFEISYIHLHILNLICELTEQLANKWHSCNSLKIVIEAVLRTRPESSMTKFVVRGANSCKESQPLVYFFSPITYIAITS